ncbi:MAG TPA: GNAT family N-acetyltransferase [Solimonas sp.]|nr:GNAT family N-acetyltransferase [Solimonas sp.]
MERNPEPRFLEDQVTTWYLEMHSRAELRPGRVPQPEPLFMQAQRALPMLNRFLYTAVGGHWYWRDRLPWSYQRWMEYLGRPGLETWVLYSAGTPAGYVELDKQAGENVEIAYFGLMREFLGQGLGGYLLTRAIARGWDMGARRVWVHTCTLDGEHALGNYQARGLKIYREETRAVQRPSRPDGPWPGAYPS